MITVEEYASFDGTGLATALRAGEVSHTEVREAAASAIGEADQRLHPFAQGPWEIPLDASSDGVFAGVPFLLKDLACHAAGVPQYLGSRALAQGLTKDHDSELMARFRRAGLATYGTVRIPEFALNATTEPLLGGPTLNPWNPALSPGGSSGGSAAMVAAGAVPIAHANDGAGSIRIPACHTGTVGLKPSRGRVPIGPDLAEAFYGNVVEFAITRTVRDTAALLDAVHGPMPGERYVAPAPSGRYIDRLTGPSERMRIAVTTVGWSEQVLHPDVVATLDATAVSLEQLGHDVDIVDPVVDFEEFLAAMTVTFCAGTASDVVPLANALGIGVTAEHFEATTVAAALAGASMTPMDLARASAINNKISRRMAAFMADYDVLVTPVAVTPPVPIGHFDANDGSLSAEEWVRRVIAPHPTCALYNVTGAPSLAVPMGMSSNGMPIGLQFGADQFREDVLIALGAELEQALPWRDRRPMLHVGTSEVPA